MRSIRLGEDLEEMRAALRRFADERLEPMARHLDEFDTLPADAHRVLADNGYLGMRLPADVGGAGLSLPEYCLVLEEFGRVHSIFTLIADTTSGLGPQIIDRQGTPEQRQRYLPGLCGGKLRTAFALTEPEAGSDAGSMRTRAVRAGDGWKVNGRKHYISGGDEADFVILLAVTDAERRGRGGITAFIVERGTPGYEVARTETTMSSSAIRLAELSFEDCLLPGSAVLGQVGDGFRYALQSLAEGRLGVACACIGAAGRALDLSVEHARTRTTFGKPLSDRQAIQWMLADSATEIEAARALTYAALGEAETSEADLGEKASMCKLFCSEMVGRVADRAVQIHGGMGLVRGYPVERIFRETRHYRIGEGTSEIHRMIIARALLEEGGARGAATPLRAA